LEPIVNLKEVVSEGISAHFPRQYGIDPSTSAPTSNQLVQDGPGAAVGAEVGAAVGAFVAELQVNVMS
jgi:hypothetical protein